MRTLEPMVQKQVRMATQIPDSFRYQHLTLVLSESSGIRPRQRGLLPSTAVTPTIGDQNEGEAHGRPLSPEMPCDWGCRAQLAVTEMRPHFTTFQKRF